MSQASSDTTERDERLKKLVEAAAGIVAGSRKLVGVTKAMDIVGFSAEERKDITIYQKVRRKSLKLTVVEVGKNQTPNMPPPPAVDAEPASGVSSLTNSSNNRSNNIDESQTTENAEEAEEEDSIASV